MLRSVLVLFLFPGFASAAADAAPPITIPWDQAEQHVGEEVTVEGRVMGVHCSELSCLIAFDPTFNRFTAVIQASSFDTLPPDSLDDRFSGKKVEVHGKIVQNDKKPEIVVTSSDDIHLTAAERRREQQAAKADAAEAQVQILERLGALLDQVASVADRMAATQERMEQLLAQMEQRQADLVAQANPPPPPEPTYGEPQPRPAYEALRTIKRGMARSEVERLVGKPDYIEYGSGGWTTWYYGFGRSISFDPRGRATSMVGFPSP
jgi:hypothetical protein